MQIPGTSRAEIPCDDARSAPPLRLSFAWIAAIAWIAWAGDIVCGQEDSMRRMPEPSFYAEAASDSSVPFAETRLVIEAPSGYLPNLGDAIFHAPPGYVVASIQSVGWNDPSGGPFVGAELRGWSPPAIPPGLIPQYLPGDNIEAPSPSDRYVLPGGPAVADLETRWTPGDSHHAEPPPCDPQDFQHRMLPDGVLWKAYLAGVKESRLSAHIISVKGDSTFFDGNLGGRFALWRYGNNDAFHPEGVEFDIEGSAHVRLDIPHDVDVRSVDFRAGAFFTWGDRWHQTKAGYYHLSSHLGDEFLLKNPGYPRLNFARDVIIIAHSVYLTEELRIYGEAGWAFWSDVTDPWEFQFGIDYSPAGPTGPGGAPFFALNGHLRQELNFGGNFVAQAGWAWKGDESGNMFRTGLHYFNGASSQFSFYQRFEQQIGFGIWFDR